MNLKLSAASLPVSFLVLARLANILFRAARLSI